MTFSMSQRFRKLATALGGFAIGYTIGALATAANTPDQDVSYEIDDDHIRRVVRREADKMHDKQRRVRWQGDADPNAKDNDSPSIRSLIDNDGALFMADEGRKEMTWRHDGGDFDGE